MPDDGSVRAATRIRRAGRWFTYSALLLPMAALSLGIAGTYLAKGLPTGVYWTLAATLAALVMVIALRWRALVATLSPPTAALYYAAACLNRLRSDGTRPGDLQYLAIMLPFLEQQLIADHLANQVAGTKIARAHVAGVQSGLVARIGRAELAWRNSGGISGGKALRESIGRAAAVVALGAWFISRTTPVAQDQLTVSHAHERAPLLGRVLDTAFAKATDALLSVAMGAIALLFAGVWRYLE